MWFIIHKYQIKNIWPSANHIDQLIDFYSIICFRFYSYFSMAHVWLMFLRRSVVMVVILLMLARSWMTPCCGLVSPRPQLASDWSMLASPGLSLVEDGGRGAGYLGYLDPWQPRALRCRHQHDSSQHGDLQSDWKYWFYPRLNFLELFNQSKKY